VIVNILSLILFFMMGVVTSVRGSCELERLEIEGHTIYTMSLELNSRETAYFALEPIIDQNRSAKWEKYRDITQKLISRDSGPLHHPKLPKLWALQLMHKSNNF
jgi:hypothetical protein